MVREKEIRRIVTIVTASIKRPVMDKGQIVQAILEQGQELTFIEKVTVLQEVSRRFGV